MTGRTPRWIGWVGLALAGAALACSAPGAGGAPNTQAPITSSSTSSIPAPVAVTATAPADPGSTCPATSDGTTLYISQENGFCFLVPAEMTGGPVTEVGARQASFMGPPLDPASMEPASARIQVTYNGPADVADSAAYAQKWHDTFAPDSPAPTTTTVGGQQVALLPEAPGMINQQIAFIVAGGQKYTIASPQPDLIPELKAIQEKAWNTITGSIVFFTPSDIPTVVLAEDVCPKAEGDKKAHIDWDGGLCMLYPASFEINSQFSAGRGWFDGGPELGQLFNAPVRANLTIAYAGPSQGQTPRQLWEPRLVNQEVSKIDVAGANDTTLGGQPAIVWTEGAPLGSRQAIIVHGDRMFTIINQPYQDPGFPGGDNDVETVWTVVTQSLVFFTPWR